MKTVTQDEIIAARVVAIVADGIQLLLFPLFAEGFISPLNDLLDIVVGLLLCNIMGFHVAFVPTFFAEEIPVLDELPTWTLTVWYVTRERQLQPK